MLGGKRVVLEYDAKPNSGELPIPAPTPPGADPAVLARARQTYQHGNDKLFAGNPAGAANDYRAALATYPGYVAGYRGLGLAYEEQGKREEALEALRTYVKTVPNAHDVALIKRRIERLEKGTSPE
jgi:tetratricopeptide (TPR) repeat protein